MEDQKPGQVVGNAGNSNGGGGLISSSSDDGNVSSSNGDNNSSNDGDERDGDSSDSADRTSSLSSSSSNSSRRHAAAHKKPNYRDYSHMKPNSTNEFMMVSSPLVSSGVDFKDSPTMKEPTFPVKLHMILSNPKFSDIISWLPHGRSWRIHNQKEFENKVIPVYFSHGRYSSFARQISGWNFKRVTAGVDFNSYYHEVSLI